MSLKQELDSSSAAGELSCLPVPLSPGPGFAGWGFPIDSLTFNLELGSGYG